MANYITLFEKFIDIIDWKLLQASSVKYNTDFRVHSLYTNQHLASMIYFHLCEHDGLRHLNQSIHDNLKGVLPSVSTATLSNHNNNRDYRVFIPVMEKLIHTGLMTLTKDKHMKKFGSVKMIDSTTISMCLTFFDWAEFRSTKAGIKIHTSIDGATGILDKLIFSNAKCHNRKVLEACFYYLYLIYRPQGERLGKDNKSGWGFPSVPQRGTKPLSINDFLYVIVRIDTGNLDIQGFKKNITSFFCSFYKSINVNLIV